MATWTESITSLEMHKVSLEQQLAESKSQLTVAQEEVDRLQNKNFDLTAENSTLNARISGFMTEREVLKQQILDLQAQLAALSPLKPALEGLITTNPSYVAGNIPYAKFASWKPWLSVLYPSPGTVNFGSVHAMLDRYPDLLFRVRIMAGDKSPDWMKTRSGGAIKHVPNTNTGAEGMVPRFWTQTYFDDYMAFMAEFAMEFEKHPQVVEIPNSLTTTIFAEPFILNADPATVTRYWNGGYRWDAVRANLMNSMDGMMELFPTTRISLAGHGKWERIIDGKMNYDWISERDVYNKLIDTYGPRLVVDDHGLDDGDAIGIPESRLTATTWYNFMAGLKTTDIPYGWQFTMKADSSKAAAAGMGVTMGACFEEFAGFSDIPEPGRQQLHEALLANAANKS